MAATDHLRVKGTENLFRALIAAGAKRIVRESMIFVYGYGDHGAAKKTEKDPRQPREQFAPMKGTVDALRFLEGTLIAAGRNGLIEAVVFRPKATICEYRSLLVIIIYKSAS